MTSDLTGAIWRKSSRSNGSTTCVEVATNLVDVTWRKSSRSNGSTNCVEVAEGIGVVGVRDSKDWQGPALAVHPAAWQAFLGLVTAEHREPR
ncbi:DUF397 domain-containing protein [Actinocatenispora comari]|jgi:hypothetical protein|uniref:DUF397 domain-containing protein n=1 Tax=Actinocatenispora comari TaxID=2807577 RepID=A0A8J4AGH3_9ACTN|nr:DUF397 domain-containing protein [Actinocatenispora comari]GIL28787.1 hypothetical protein NUM_40410 [Actinocatenispora comari]